MPASGNFNCKLFSGSSHPELSHAISRRLGASASIAAAAEHSGIPLSPSHSRMLSSGEITLDLRESVREADVYIIKCVGESENASIALRRALVERWLVIDAD